MTNTPESPTAEWHQTAEMLFALNGENRPVACGWKQAGLGGSEWNLKTKEKWEREGLRVITIHEDDPECRRLFDLTWSRV